MFLFFIKSLVGTLIWCQGLVLSSSIPAGTIGDVKLFQSPLSYALESTLFLNDVTSVVKEVGYKIKAKVLIDPVYSTSPSEHILKFELNDPKLYITPKGTNQGYIEHKSLLDSFKNSPFFAIWRNGYIEKVYVDGKEEASLINVKKSILSLLQFQILDGERNETDISGTCQVSYHTLSPTVFRKYKKHCVHPLVKEKRKDDRMLDAVTSSLRLAKYEFTEDLTALKHIYAEELHYVKVSINHDIGNKARVWLSLRLEEANSVSEGLRAVDLAAAERALHAAHPEHVLLPDLALAALPALPARRADNNTTSNTLSRVLKENRENLKAELLGTEKSAAVFLKVLKAMKESSPEEILKALKGVKNKEILQQMCDVLGSAGAGSLATHLAARAFLNVDAHTAEHDAEYVERYLWALAQAPVPHPQVILDVVKMYDKSLPESVSETVLLTASAMAHRLAVIEGDNHLEVSNKVKDVITKKLSKCTESECRVRFLRALHNLRRADTVEILLDHIQKGQKPVTVMAFKALKSMPKDLITDRVMKICYDVFHQVKRKYDSSARTLALDIILEKGPYLHHLVELLHYLKCNDTEVEVKQLLLQWLRLKSEQDEDFAIRVLANLRNDRSINNWDVMAPKGMSTAIERQLAGGAGGGGAACNVSVLSVQELAGGLLKRGHVDLRVRTHTDHPTHATHTTHTRLTNVFSLGLFASGLSSLLGAGDDSEGGQGGEGEGEGEEAETVGVGLELSVQGVQLRPFHLFSGQAELMGHVWAGTASDTTPVYQALVVLQELEGRVVVATGALATWRLAGAASCDLAAQIQVSLWNRVSHSLVEESAGVVVEGGVHVELPFVQLRAAYGVSLQPRLRIDTDADFYGDVALCVRVDRPDTTLRHTITKVERVPMARQGAGQGVGAGHRLRRRAVRTYSAPGATYALNAKNTDMCNAIHNK